jgi:hypothetical protein
VNDLATISTIGTKGMMYGCPNPSSETDRYYDYHRVKIEVKEIDSMICITIKSGQVSLETKVTYIEAMGLADRLLVCAVGIAEGE